jgi:hypothetical protein
MQLSSVNSCLITSVITTTVYLYFFLINFNTVVSSDQYKQFGLTYLKPPAPIYLIILNTVGEEGAFGRFWVCNFLQSAVTYLLYHHILTLSLCAVILSTSTSQRIITPSVFNYKASSLTQHLACYRVRNFYYTNMVNENSNTNKIQYSLLGRTAASTRLNTTFRGLTPSPSSGKTNQFCLRMGTELVPETYSNKLTRLCAREDYIESCRRESFKTYN